MSRLVDKLSPKFFEAAVRGTSSTVDGKPAVATVIMRNGAATVTYTLTGAMIASYNVSGGVADDGAPIESMSISYESIEYEYSAARRRMTQSLRGLLRAPTGPVDVTTIATDATPGAPGDSEKTEKAFEESGAELAELQERLYAEGTIDGATRRVLLVLQGMDTSGKGGTIKHVVGRPTRSASQITSFKKPTEEELAHHFLWRIRKARPGAGQASASSTARTTRTCWSCACTISSPPEIWRAATTEINAFERELAGTA